MPPNAPMGCGDDMNVPRSCGCGLVFTIMASCCVDILYRNLGAAADRGDAERGAVDGGETWLSACGPSAAVSAAGRGDETRTSGMVFVSLNLMVEACL